jgi:hypothetical protein
MATAADLDLSKMSISDLEKLEERITAAKLVPTGERAIGLIAVLKESFRALREIDEALLGSELGQISPQALPKEATTARRYGLSETQAKNAKDKALKAIAGI